MLENELADLFSQSNTVHVCRAKMDTRKEPRVFPKTECSLSSNCARDPVPAQWRTFIPEASNVALFGCSRGAIYASDIFDLLIVPAICLTGQIEILGRIRSKLFTVVQAKGRDIAPSWEGGRQVARRCRLPDSGSRGLRIGNIGRCRTIIASDRQNRGRGSLSHSNAECFRVSIVRERSERCLIGRIDSRLL